MIISITGSVIGCYTVCFHSGGGGGGGEGEARDQYLGMGMPLWVQNPDTV